MLNEQQPGEVIYFIITGAVKVYVEQSDGAQLALSVLGAGDIVGEISLLDDDGRSATVITLEETEALWMARPAFHEFLRTIPILGYNLARMLARRLRAANKMTQALAIRDVESRVASQLLAFADRFGELMQNGDILIPVRLTQSDFASLVGASRESVNRVIVSYKDRRYLSVDSNHRFTIHNRNALLSRCPKPSAGRHWPI
jgi:CRP-like cAMP-binding protein